MNYSLNSLQTAISGSWNISIPSKTIEELYIDSRKIKNGKKAIFIAIKGSRLNGHNYIGDAYEKGVRNFVIDEDVPFLKDTPSNYVLVPNSTIALQELASFHRQHFNIPIIAITGSNGKTIVKEWFYQLLQEDYVVCKNPNSYNSQIGVPLSVLKLNNTHTLGVFEAGISEPNEMFRLKDILQPNIGVFTNIGSAHGENFNNIEQKIKEKLILFKNSRVLIYSSENQLLNNTVLETFKNKSIELISWGALPQDSIKILQSIPQKKGTELKLSFKEKKLSFYIPFIDSSSLQNAMHIISFMLYQGFSEQHINTSLKKLQRVSMRLEQKQGINQSIIINDCYNSDIESFTIALDYLKQQRENQNQTVILSDILQHTLPKSILYSKVYELLKQHNIDRFIGIGKDLKIHKTLFDSLLFKRGLNFYTSTDEFLKHYDEDTYSNEIILLKGARSFTFECISDVLEEKVHATILEIKLNAILNNLNVFQKNLHQKTKVMVMVKAFSYGTSAVEVAKLLAFNKVDYFGVAYADEGILLRKSGVNTPIMVLNPEYRSFNNLIKHHLEPEIYSLSLLQAFEKALLHKKITKPYPIHLNIDTGMNRLGFGEEEISELIEHLKGNKKIKITSIFSHLVSAENPKEDSFTNSQINDFKKIAKKICSKLSISPMLHIANSSGIARFKNAEFDMVRLGIGLYGFNKTYQNKLQTVAQLKSKISQIKKIKKGESVGYGRKAKVIKNSLIATISIGYADGVNRLLSNGNGSVFLHGKKAPFIGFICMDMAMVDISSIPEASVGDVVEVFGENILIEEVAKKTQTIPYEVLTAVSERVQRVFYME